MPKDQIKFKTVAKDIKNFNNDDGKRKNLLKNKKWSC